jgi:excisionase family DNA binding protein
VTQSSLPRRRQLTTQQQAAAHFQVHERTIRNWISEGLITGYRLPTGRAIRVDLAEIEQMIKAIPTVRATKLPFGPKARIVDMSNVANPSAFAEGNSKQQSAEIEK